MNFQKTESKSNLNLKSLFLITMVVFCASAGLFAVNVGIASATIAFFNIEVHTIKDTSVVIRYDTLDEVAIGQIEYGLTTSYGNLTNEYDRNFWQVIEIINLIPRTTYHYRIKAKNYEGEETISNDYTFTTRTTAELQAVITAERNNQGAPTDNPQIYYVRTDGNNSNTGTGNSASEAWATPSFAADNVYAGDTIYLIDNTPENPDDATWVDEFVTFANSGIDVAPITMKRYNGAPTLRCTTPEDGYTMRGIYILNRTYITIDGITVRNYETHIGVRQSNNIQILNCSVYTENPVGVSPAGIYFHEGCHNCKADKCYIEGNAWSSIIIMGRCYTTNQGITDWFFDPSTRIIISNCIACNNTLHPLVDIYGTSEYISIINNTFYNGWAGSVYSHQGYPDHFFVNGNTIYDCADGMYFCRGMNDSVIEDNIIYDTNTAGQGHSIRIPQGHTYTYEYISRNNIIVNNHCRGDVNFYMVYGAGINILLDNNDVYSDYGDNEYRLDNNITDATVRNAIGEIYKVRSAFGANITVEYTDGRTFFVDGSDEYSTYAFSDGTKTIDVISQSSIGAISGAVTDNTTGNPIQGATISDGARLDDTNSSGYYTISNVPVGTYTVTASADGYQDGSQSNVVVNEGQTTTVNFQLTELEQDITSPVRSDGSPSGILFYGTTQAILSLTTDENATCRYSTTAGIAYSSMTPPAGGTFSTTGTTFHSTTVSGLSDGNTYTYYIKCIDSSSNVNTNDYSITFSVSSEPSTDLVAHWKFDENTGNIACDSSENNNDGILTNMDVSTAWVEGKINSALDFDGNNDYVNYGSDSSLNITDAITIEAWVKPNVWGSDGTIIRKSNAYLIDINTGTQFRFWLGNVGARTYSVSEYSLDEWIHLVGVYSGSRIAFYINGNEKSAANASGNITINGSNLLIGAETPTGDLFNGSIDEVRIYNRALSAEEVLAHYNEGNAPEINHLPIGFLDTATQTSITGWAYDQNADSNPIDVHIYIDGINVGSAAANQSRPDLVSAGVTQDPNHGFTFSTPSLSIGEHTVNVYAINHPEGTNPELIGSPKTFTVSSSDSTPPTGSIQINSGNEKTNSQTVNLSISANDPSGLSEMKISNTNDFNSVIAEAYSTIKSWVLSTGDGLKTIYIWFKDNIGNWNSSPYSDTITLDTTNPTISNISISSITTNTAIINFQTNEPTTSHLEYGLTSSYGNSTSPNPSLLSTFDIQLSSLSSDTTYHFKIISKDELENESNSTDQTFKTIGLPDTTPPNKITDLSSSNITQTSVDLSWTSKGDDGNNGTAASYDLRFSSNLISDSSTLTEKNNWWDNSTQLTGEPIPSLSGTEQYISVGLSSNTNYYFIIKSGDEIPNWSDYSNILSFKTLATPPASQAGGQTDDITPPSQPTNFKAIPADSQITLNWKNPSDSDFVRVLILRKENSSPTSHNDSLAKIVYEGTNQQYTDINLNNETTYYYSIFSYDKKPNYSEILSISSKPIEGKESIEIPNETSYPESTLLKTSDSFKIYIIINQKKKWIPTPEVFETLGYQWTSITIIDKNQLTLIPDYEDNLIRAINDFKVYLIVNGIKRHFPNPEIFLNYGFAWNEVKDVNQETINQYIQCNLIKESKKEEVYYLCPERKIKRWLRSPEIFNSYPDNDWNNIQVISKYEMDHYPTSNLIKLHQSNDVYLIEGNKKRLINSAEEFEREGLDWGKVMGVGRVEWEWFGN